MTRNIRLILQYDGTHYQGWQRQAEGKTLQALLEEMIQKMTGVPSTLIASGRTDAGVHALCQVCHFFTTSVIEPHAIKRGLNSMLPWDIRIRQADDVPLDFHARFSAESKTYEYRILNRKDPDVFLRNYTWHVPLEINRTEMAKCLLLLQGRHDFSSFRSSGSGNVNPVRHMIRAEMHSSVEGILRLIFEADGFLRHMVRNIVGTLVDVGRGRMDAGVFLMVLQAGDRRLAGFKAPPQGLFLTMVKYAPPLL